MKAISIHQPWAWAILHAGKTIENRRWATKYRGPLLIHASKTKSSYDEQDPAEWRRVFGVELPPWESLTLGAVIGIVELVDCLRIGDLAKPSPWATGPVCWRMKNPRIFAVQILTRGMQGLFEVESRTPSIAGNSQSERVIS